MKCVGFRVSMVSSAATLTTLSIVVVLPGLALAQAGVQPRTMPQIGQVGERFVSYNVEAVEVTGGRFWKPYKSAASAPDPSTAPAKAEQNQPAGMDANLFQYRPPIDLSNPRLRRLAAALAPSFVRVSGTWRNSTFFQDDDKPALTAVPEGYKGVMTRAEWKGVIDFSHAVNADLVTSVATSQGVRDSNGLWTPEQAQEVFDYTKSLGGKIVATEFMNEPTFAAIGGAPGNYDAEAFAKDVKVFREFLRKQSPDTIFLGPGSVGEGAPMTEGMPMPKIVATEDMLKDTGPVYDAFSYHFYGTVSRRCAGPVGAMTPERVLSQEFLGKNLAVEEFYAHLRDQYEPGLPIWLTETGEAACGGDPWASTFLDAFRYMDQLGTLAQKSVQTVIVNTLASSDYGLLDETTLEPRPDYWAALLWKRTMGTRVLDPGATPSANTHIYAQCMKNAQGGVAMLVLNLDRSSEQILKVPISGARFTLSAPDLVGEKTLLNGVELKAASDGTLPEIKGEPMKGGSVRFAPLTISFITLPDARNASCMK